MFIVRAIYYAQQRVRGVRITPTQFPEAYQMLAEAAEAAGLRRVPDAYVVRQRHHERFRGRSRLPPLHLPVPDLFGRSAVVP